MKIRFISNPKARKIQNLSDNSEVKPVKISNNILAEYHETLYSDGHTPISKHKTKTYSNSIFLKDVKGIETNVDTINKTDVKSVDSNIGKKVDRIFKIKPIKKSIRKPSNVIYVVSKPQPGQVKGDWAVRSHGKIYSHHRTKQAAIKKAREVAKEREATVMVQNTNGAFSIGFKPRKK